MSRSLPALQCFSVCVLARRLCLLWSPCVSLGLHTLPTHFHSTCTTQWRVATSSAIQKQLPWSGSGLKENPPKPVYNSADLLNADRDVRLEHMEQVSGPKGETAGSVCSVWWFNGIQWVKTSHLSKHTMEEDNQDKTCKERTCKMK